MSGTATALDHVGIVVRDAAAARAAWEAAGFAPTPRGRDMLRQGYIELLAQDAAKPSATLAAMLAQGEGAHVLSLRAADADAAAARLRRIGFDAELIEIIAHKIAKRQVGQAARCVECHKPCKELLRGEVSPRHSELSRVHRID